MLFLFGVGLTAAFVFLIVVWMPALIMKLNTWFTKVAETVSHAAGHAVAFIST